MNDLKNIDEIRKSREPARNPGPVSGFSWELLCIASLAVAFLLSLATFCILLIREVEPGFLLTGITLILAIILLKLTPWLHNKYRDRQRHLTLSAPEVRAKDMRPAVLYLRSFEDDASMTKVVAFTSVEQEISGVLSEIGPFITLKGERESPDIGAARLSSTLTSWRKEVVENMVRSRLVFMRVGNTEGLLWELGQAPKLFEHNPEKLVLWIPAAYGEYETFRLNANTRLPYPLPEYQIKRSLFGDHGGIIYFKPGWVPHLRRFEMVWFRQTFYHLFAAIFKIGMRPVYEQLGVPWSKPPVKLIQVLYMLMLFLLTVLGVYMVYDLFVEDGSRVFGIVQHSGAWS